MIWNTLRCAAIQRDYVSKAKKRGGMQYVKLYDTVQCDTMLTSKACYIKIKVSRRGVSLIHEVSLLKRKLKRPVEMYLIYK